jgi:hypothetical protein
MNAKAVVARLLEADPDDIDPKADARRYTETQFFDEGMEDIVGDARRLYLRLVEAGVVVPETDSGEGKFNIGRRIGYDSMSVAQAVMRLAIKQRGSPGGESAYKDILRHGHSVI